jgi:hypothetical protein
VLPWIILVTGRGCVDAVGGPGKTVGRQLAPGEAGKVRAEVARHVQFTTLCGRITEVSERIRVARPPSRGADGSPSGTGGGSGTPSRRSGPLR